jgi:hypothetical protein
MKSYPEVIDLAKYSNVSDAEIVKDIADTEFEIQNLEQVEKAERAIAETHPSPHERRLADFKAGARPLQIAERQAFVAFLRRIQAARSVVIDPVTLCRRVDLAADRLNRPTPVGTDSPSYISAMRDAGRMR